VVIDNLKAGVLRADWYDPELNPKIEEFAQHYGTAILPSKPKTPRHKGKVEAGVKYAQDNAAKGRRFESKRPPSSIWLGRRSGIISGKSAVRPVAR
jgi:transposase